MSFDQYPGDFDTLNEWHAQRLILLMKHTDSTRKSLEQYKKESEKMLRKHSSSRSKHTSSRSSRRYRRSRHHKKRSSKSRRHERRIGMTEHDHAKLIRDARIEDVSGNMTIISQSSARSSNDEIVDDAQTDMNVLTKEQSVAQASVQFELPNDLFLSSELKGTSLCSSPPRPFTPSFACKELPAYTTSTQHQLTSASDFENSRQYFWEMR